jgi:hypothetical protein
MPPMRHTMRQPSSGITAATMGGRITPAAPRPKAAMPNARPRRRTNQREMQALPGSEVPKATEVGSTNAYSTSNCQLAVTRLTAI